MKRKLSPDPAAGDVDISRMAEAISRIQKANGEIPWSMGGKTDPWDHIESAMGLAVAGYLSEARRAFEWSAASQLEDGSWWASYKDGAPEEKRKDPNMSSYIAVGVLHYYLITGDGAFLEKMWPAVSAAVDFALRLQAPEGQIYWSMDENGFVEDRALLTGSSSIYLSLKCALAISARLHKSRPLWEFAMRKLGKSIRCRSHLYDQTKSRYSMDWYYPILAGAVSRDMAHERIDASWDKFVVKHWGVRCVADRPWVTMAESAELVLALAGIGRMEEAEKVFSWIRDSRFDDGLYWTGITCPDSIIWPEERTAWTTAAILLAGDALYAWTAGSGIFSHGYWEEHPTHVRAASPIFEKLTAAAP